MGCCFSAEKDSQAPPSKAPSHPLSPSVERIKISPRASIKIEDKENARLTNKDGYKYDVIYTEQQRRDMSLKHKTKGNEHFKNKKFHLAIEEYTKAIILYDQDSTYFSNRALTFKSLAQWDNVIMDSDSSINLDSNNYKAYHLKGVGLIEIGKKEQSNKKIEEGIGFLIQSKEILIRSRNDKTATEELDIKIKKAKKVLYLKENEQSEQKKFETTQFVKNLIHNDTQTSTQEQSEMIKLFESFVNENKESFEIPEEYQCKITFEMMKEPILLPSGHTYEQEVIKEHLSKVGPFDPLTRQPINVAKQKLVKNKNLSEAIKDFEEKNPWSFLYGGQPEDYREINL